MKQENITELQQNQRKIIKVGKMKRTGESSNDERIRTNITRNDFY